MTAAAQYSVLIVEDDAMIRMMLAEMLAELGYVVAGEATNLQEAKQLAQSSSFDIAILDLNLGEHRVDPVADIVIARNLPFIFATGFGAADLPESFRGRPVLQKPFGMEQLGKTLESVLKG